MEGATRTKNDMYIKLIPKTLVLDFMAICVYWLFACGLDYLAKIEVSQLFWVSLFLVVAGVFYFALFFIHSPLFHGWIKNDYVWSLTTGIFTFIVFLPVVIASVHHSCPWL